MSASKDRTRRDYGYFLTYRTRWSDNDQYAHVNNATYYFWFDSVINTFLQQVCGQIPTESPYIGLVVSSYCEFYSPVSFPQEVDVGLRVVQLGKSSVKYEVGVFVKGEDAVSAVGGYTHVFVSSETRKSAAIPDKTRQGLSTLLSPSTSKL